MPLCGPIGLVPQLKALAMPCMLAPAVDFPGVDVPLMGPSSCKLHCNNCTLMHAGRATAGTLSSVLTLPRCVQEFFETHESDAYVLKHDKQLAKDPQQQRHLRHLPEYIKESAGVQAGSRKKGNAVRGIKRKLRPDDDPLRVRN